MLIINLSFSFGPHLNLVSVSASSCSSRAVGYVHIWRLFNIYFFLLPAFWSFSTINATFRVLEPQCIQLLSFFIYFSNPVTQKVCYCQALLNLHCQDDDGKGCVIYFALVPSVTLYYYDSKTLFHCSFNGGRVCFCSQYIFLSFFSFIILFLSLPLQLMGTSVYSSRSTGGRHT